MDVLLSLWSDAAYIYMVSVCVISLLGTDEYYVGLNIFLFEHLFAIVAPFL